MSAPGVGGVLLEMELPAQVANAFRQGTLRHGFAKDFPRQLRDGLPLHRCTLLESFLEFLVRGDGQGQVGTHENSLLQGSADHPENLTEIEGAADLVVEIVSNSSVGKDTKRLPRLYARADIPEIWITDARGRDLRFQIHTLRDRVYVPVEPEADGWMPSPRLGVAFRLVRQASPFTGWEYTLERRG
jgi:hypothetical protein